MIGMNHRLQGTPFIASVNDMTKMGSAEQIVDVVSHDERPVIAIEDGESRFKQNLMDSDGNLAKQRTDFDSDTKTRIDPQLSNTMTGLEMIIKEGSETMIKSQTYFNTGKKD